MSCIITYNGQNFTQEDFLDYLKSQIPVLQSTTVTPTEFINHSGGAKGYDAEWDIIGSEYGMVNNKHYLLPEDGEVSDLRLRSKGVKPVDATNDIGHVAKTGLAIGGAQIAVTNAERAMGRIESNHTTRNTKKIRNYAQVKNADGIFAIGSLIPKGAEITIARGQQTKIALVPQVNGGTSVAVQLSIMQGKPTYVFNQVENSVYSQGWYKWDNTVKDFVSTETPTLTKNFAGIGTSSNTTEAGKQAIRNVYEKTFGNSTSIQYSDFGTKTASKNVKIDPNKVENKTTTNKPQSKDFITNKVNSSFDKYGYVDILTSGKNNFDFKSAVIKYILKDLGLEFKSDKELNNYLIKEKNEGRTFNLMQYVTLEELPDNKTRVKLNKRNLLLDSVEDFGPRSLGGLNFTSSGRDFESKNIFKNNIEQAFNCK